VRVGAAIQVLILLAALAMRLFVAAAAPMIEVDGAYWCERAAAFARGDPARGFHAAWPPLYPATVALFARALELFGSPAAPATLEWAARLVSVAAGTLVLLPLRSLARRLLPEPWATAAVVLAAVHPRLIEYSAAALSESLFTLLLVAGLAAAAATWAPPAVDPPRTRLRDALGGAAFGLAFLVRPEGLPLGLATWMALAASGRGSGRGALARLRPLFPIAMMLVAVPWLLFLRADTGQWTLGEKGPYNFWRAHREAHARHWPAPAALPARVNRSPELAPAAVPGEVRPVALLLAEPVAVIGTSARNLATLVASTYPVAIGWPIAVFAIAGLFVARAGPWWAVLAPLAAAPLLVAPFSADRRLLVPLVPLALPLAAAAFHALARWRPGRLAPAVAGLLAAGVLTYAFGLPGRMDDAPELREAGEWLRGRGDGGVVMARKPQVAFYAGGLIADLPAASLDSILADARRTGVDVLVADARSARGDRGSIAAWLDPARAPAGWRVLRRWDGADGLVLYAPAADYSRGSIR